MKKEKLVIKNFGPLKSVNLELGKMTILIGDQATGKSTVAKVLAMCRYFSYIVNFKTTDSPNFHINDQFERGLNNWGLSHYLISGSEIFYECPIYTFELKGEFVEVNDLSIFSHTRKSFLSISEGFVPPKHMEVKPLTRIKGKENFSNLLAELKELKEDELNQEPSNSLNRFLWSPNENFYRLNVRKVMDNPLYISTERGLQTLSYDKNLLIPEAIQDNLKKNNRIVRGHNVEKQIEPLSLTFKNISGLGYIKKEDEDEFYPLHYGASGHQAVIPIVLGIKYYIEIEKKYKTFIIEEPELNLFPKTQKKLVEFLAESMNFGHSFLIPTHSPYILNSLNNLMVAYRIGQTQKNQVDKIIPEKYWVNPTNVGAYKLIYSEEEKGFVSKTIINNELKEIDIDYLNEINGEINGTWDDLFQLEQRLKE